MSGETLAGLQHLLIEHGAPLAIRDYAQRLASPAGDATLEALRALTEAISSKHYGRMPEQVQKAYDNARAILSERAQGGAKT